MSNKAVVVLSGGMDSTICLMWAKQKFEYVEAVHITYAQRHSIETAAAVLICNKQQIPITIIKEEALKVITKSALLDDQLDINAKHINNPSLPASFVPGRNILILTLAAMFAYTKRISNLVTGVCQTDYSGYPDCRQSTINLLECTLNAGMQYRFHILTPLMYKTKAQSIELAKNIPDCLQMLAYSHTCYNGAVPPCEQCPACKLRQKGFKEAGIVDPLRVRTSKDKDISTPSVDFC